MLGEAVKQNAGGTAKSLITPTFRFTIAERLSQTFLRGSDLRAPLIAMIAIVIDVHNFLLYASLDTIVTPKTDPLVTLLN